MGGGLVRDLPDAIASLQVVEIDPPICPARFIIEAELDCGISDLCHRNHTSYDPLAG